jgi:hypothetical protein
MSCCNASFPSGVSPSVPEDVASSKDGSTLFSNPIIAREECVERRDAAGTAPRRPRTGKNTLLLSVQRPRYGTELI